MAKGAFGRNEASHQKIHLGHFADGYLNKSMQLVSQIDLDHYGTSVLDLDEIGGSLPSIECRYVEYFRRRAMFALCSLALTSPRARGFNCSEFGGLFSRIRKVNSSGLVSLDFGIRDY